MARRRGARGKGFAADEGPGKPPAVPTPEPGGITARLLALGWQWNSRGVLVQPEGFEGCRLSEFSDSIGSRYSIKSKGETIYRLRDPNFDRWKEIQDQADAEGEEG